MFTRNQRPIFHLHIKGQCGISSVGRSANLDESCQAVVGIASCVQVVLVFLRDVWHQHIHQCLHCMIERCRKALVPGELDRRNQKERFRWGKGLEKRRLDWNTTYFDFSALYEIMSHWLHQRFKEVPWVLQHRDGANERKGKNVLKKRAGLWQTESLASDSLICLNSTNPVKNSPS